MTPFRAVAHPWQCDVLGHMTTRHYVAVFDDASYHFLNDIFGWGGVVDADGKRGWVDVSHHIQYQVEVAAGDPLEVTARLTKLGTKSLGARYEMKNLRANDIAASLDVVYVLFDMEQRQGLVIDEALREQAERHLQPADAGESG